MNSTGKIAALINLLDDPDTEIYGRVKNELLCLGHEIVPTLESAWETSFNAVIQQRLEVVIHEIQLQDISKRLEDWIKKGGQSLVEGAILIARYQYSDIDENYILNFLEQLTQDIWIELNGNLTALEKAGVINKIFFEIYGFAGNKKNFHSARNSFINNVLENRKGSPISLSILYLEVARRLKIPIYGVNLPEHFVVAYTELPIEYIDDLSQKDVLFYINPFNKGTIFQQEDIATFLKQLKIDAQEKFYLPCNNLQIIQRLINNLIFSFGKDGYQDKERELKNLLRLFGEQ